MNRIPNKLNEFTEFRPFAARYFSGDYMNRARELMRAHKPPVERKWAKRVGLSLWRFDEQIADGRLHKFRSPRRFYNYRGPVHKRLLQKTLLRDFNQHPLKRDEYLQAHEYLRANPEFHMAIAAVQACVNAYLQDFYKGYGRHYFQRGSVVAMSDKSTFLQTLSPTLAFILSENEKEGAPDLWEGGLTALFKKSTFQSLFNTKYARPKQVCPFSGPFPYVFSTRLSRDAHGDIVAEEGQFGDLVKFLMDDIREKVPQADRDKVALDFEF